MQPKIIKRKTPLTLVEQQAALMIRDEQLDQRLSETVIDLIKNKEKQQLLSHHIGKIGKPEAAKRIAEEAIRLMNRK